MAITFKNSINYAVVAVSFLALGTISAVTVQELTTMRLAALPMLIACGKEVEVTAEQMLAATKAKDPDMLDPCYFACFFKKTGIMTDNGLFELDGFLNIHKKYIQNEENLKEIAEIGKTCSSLNDQTDEGKGCERSKLLVHCLSKLNSDVYTPNSS